MNKDIGIFVDVLLKICFIKNLLNRTPSLSKIEIKIEYEKRNKKSEISFFFQTMAFCDYLIKESFLFEIEIARQKSQKSTKITKFEVLI